MPKAFVPPPGYTDLLAGEDSRSTKQYKRARAKGRSRNTDPHRIPEFASLPYRQRREETVRLGWRIRTDANGRGLFLTHSILPGSREWPDEDQGGLTTWVDAVFLPQGVKQPDFFFDAHLETAAAVAARTLLEQARAAIEAQMTPEEREETALGMFVGPPEKGGSCPVVFAPPVGAASLNGLTPQGAQAAWLRERWNDRFALAPIGESAAFAERSCSGRSVRLVTAEPNLTVDAVVRAINRFRERGEQAFADPILSPAALQPQFDALLEATLWRWEHTQAEFEGREHPAPTDQMVHRAAGAHSNAVRL